MNDFWFFAAYLITHVNFKERRNILIQPFLLLICIPTQVCHNTRTWKPPLGSKRCFLPSLGRIELTNVKARPCRPPIHDLACHFSFLSPPSHIQIYHTNSVALLCSRGKLFCRSRRGISRQRDLGQMLQ